MNEEKDVDVTGKPRVLIVDDHADTADLLGMFLERRGFFVQSADSVARALEVFASDKFDVVVSDLMLPDGSGFELIKQLRTQVSVPAVALSGSGQPEDMERSKIAGFNVHLVKPVGGDRLVETLRSLLN